MFNKHVSTFTEGLAWELKETGVKMRAKVQAPVATKTEFGMGANNVSEYDYDKSFGTSADPERHRDMRIPINQLVFPV